MAFGNNVYNTKNSDGTTLGWSPDLNFGGNNTGIVYSYRLGEFQRIGNIVFFSFQFELLNKGSATGTATIDGLPFAVSVPTTSLIVTQQALDLDPGFNFACVFPIGTSLQLNQSSETTTGLLTDANFNNTTLISGSGIYFA